MQTEYILWIVGFIFFQPLHLGMPVLYVFVYCSEKERKEKIRHIILDGLISSCIFFVIAAWVWSNHLYIALGLILLSIPLPWARLLFKKSKP